MIDTSTTTTTTITCRTSCIMWYALHSTHLGRALVFLRKNIPPSERKLLGMRYAGLVKAAALPEAAASWYGEGRASTLVFSRCTPPARHSERERGRYESRDSVPHAREGGVRLSPWVVAGIAAGSGRRLGPPRAIMAVDNRRGVGGDSCRIPSGSSFG